MRKLVLVSVLFGSLLAASTAHAAIPSALGVTCNVAADGVRECGSTSPRSTSPSWDGTPIDVNVAFPAVPSGSDGNYPLIIIGHGYGGSKIGFGASGSTSGMREFTSRGYAVFCMTDRGFHESCGSPASFTAGGSACDNGYIHLMDDRYEVRDAQFFAGELADEGLVNGQKVGATGGSYGGGLSLALASLKDRVMMPDGSLVPWTSPTNHLPMRIAAATPLVPWSDLAYSLTPNGGTLDYVADSAYTGRTGIEKESFQTGLYLSGSTAGHATAARHRTPRPCTDFGADVTAWKARLDAGEPYDGDPTMTAILNEIEAHHSAYYIDHSEPPAPLLICERLQRRPLPGRRGDPLLQPDPLAVPERAGLALLRRLRSHARGQQAGRGQRARCRAERLVRLLRQGRGIAALPGCHRLHAHLSESPTPSGGPFQAGSWAGLQHGVVRLRDDGTKTISANGGSSTVDTDFDPVSGGGACADGLGRRPPRGGDLPSAGRGGQRLHADGLRDRDRQDQLAHCELGDGGEASRRRPERDRDPRGSSAVQAAGRHGAPGLPAPPERPPLRAWSCGEARAAAARRGRFDAQQLRARRERPGGHHGVRASTCACRCSTDPGAAGGQVTAAPALPLPCGTAIAPQFSSDSYLRATLGDGKLRFKGRKGKVPVDSAPGLNPCQVQHQAARLGQGERPLGQDAEEEREGARRGERDDPGRSERGREAEAQQAAARPRSGGVAGSASR